MINNQTITDVLTPTTVYALKTKPPAERLPMDASTPKRLGTGPRNKGNRARRFHVYLDPTTDERLRVLMEVTEANPSAVLRAALADYAEKLQVNELLGTPTTTNADSRITQL